MPNLQHISDAVWCFFGSWQPASLFTFIIKKGHYMDHFHISKVLRSESHHSWVNLYRGDSDRVWNDMRMSKWWLNFIFGCNFQPHAESHTPPVHGKALAWSAWHAPVMTAAAPQDLSITISMTPLWSSPGFLQDLLTASLKCSQRALAPIQAEWARTRSEIRRVECWPSEFTYSPPV